MPIITVQRRMAEQGRIRLGHQVTGTSKAGKTYTRPAKLDRFRFTSPNARLIDEIAATYGGTAHTWDNDGKAEHEVISDATSIPVIVVKGGFSQWHEFWTKAGCQHRCDGEKDPAGNFCDPSDPAHQHAVEKPTTRLSVMLSEIETLGVWRMESKGWNAAAELPSMAELAMHVGDLVPATLSLAERSSVIQVDGKPQTSRYVVPVLDLHVTKRRLVELVGGQNGAPALEQRAPAEAKAIEAPRRDFTPDVGGCQTVEACRALWVEIRDSGWMTEFVDAAIKARVAELQQTQSAGEPQVVEGTVEPDPPAAAAPVDDDAAWMAVVAEAGRAGLDTAGMKRAYEDWTQGELLDDAGTARLVEFREYLTKQAEQVPA